MPRDLPVGNGSLLVNFDSVYQLRDIYFPHVGKENQSAGHPFRFGVWVNGVFRWIDDDKWQRDLRYESDTLVTSVGLQHPDLPVSIVSSDIVDFHENLYLRRLRVTSESDVPLDARFFFHHDFHLYESEIGDTAYYEPRRKVIFHYKDLRWFLINGSRGSNSFGVDQFATGQKEVNGLEGTWRDAEDGALSGNPIAQGSIDSTIALHLTLDPRGFGELYYWIAAGERFDDVTAINRRVLDKTPATIVNRNGYYWRLWVKGSTAGTDVLPHDIAQLYSRSLLVVRTQIDNDGGIIAANDFDITRFNRDTYSYVWPRDGSLVTSALISAGFAAPSRAFLNFCARVLTNEGYFLHKYNADGSLASSWLPWYADNQAELPIQEDETALVLWVLWRYFEQFHEVEVVKPLYRDLVTRAADFLVRYRDSESRLPEPSWDLWEERRGIQAWTTAATWAGLEAAANFADAFGEFDRRDSYRGAAADIKQATDIHLWNETAGRFARMVTPLPDGQFEADLTVDASLAGLFLFGMYSASDPRVSRTMEAVRNALWIKTSVGGIARYENDSYQRVSADISQVPG
ncbi:MAG TPA: glycoside hydrolase family 15 protein, partial [Chloroflexota bacterium]|nr:glycoside hydrolase family 15 protein [Chloroflexota bacterium]